MPIRSVLLPALLLSACGSAPTNPPVRAEPPWDTPRTRELAVRACFDCHSNETRWPVYTTWPVVGPAVRRHVIEGRDVLNFSEWDRSQEETDEVVEVLIEGGMPLPSYLWMHPSANLGSADRTALIAGLRHTLGGDGAEEYPERGPHDRTDDDDDDDNHDHDDD